MNAFEQTTRAIESGVFEWNKRDRIIWELSQFKDEDWNFEPHKHELQGKEGRTAFEYELARHMPYRVETARELSRLDLKSRREAERWSESFPAWANEDDLRQNPLKGFQPGPWFAPEFPHVPWFLIPYRRRKEIVESAIDVVCGDPLRSVSLAKTISLYADRPVGWDAEEDPGTYRCVFVIDRTFSDSQIKVAFQKEWLDSHPQERTRKKRNPERQHWFPLLKALGMLRILDCHQNNRAKADVFLQRKFGRMPNASFDTSAPAWSKAKMLMNNYLNMMHYYV